MSPTAPAKPGTAPSILSQINEAKSQITRTQRLMLISAGIVLATAVIGLIGIQMPWQERRQRLAAQYNEEKERSEQLVAIQRQKTELKGMESQLLLEGGVTGLAGQLSRLATQSGLQVESVTPQPEIAADPYTRFQIEITATSNLANILQFLRVIEDHRPLFWIEQMEMGEAATDSSYATSMGLLEEVGPYKPKTRQKVRFLIGAVGRQKSSG